MIARYSARLGGWALLIGLALPRWAAAADVAPAKQPPAPAAKAAKPHVPAAQPPKAVDDDYEMCKLLIDTIDQVERNYVTKVSRRELIEAAIRGMMSKLDPYSGYISPRELGRFRASMESEFGGIGVQVAIEGDQLRIISPMCGTPAYRAGLLAGDRILEIDGRSTDGLTLDEDIGKLKGEEGKPVTLTVIHPGKRDREKISLVRQRIHLETVLGDRRKADGGWDFMLDPKQGIGYVRLTVFSRDTATRLRTVLSTLLAQKLRGLILDLRFDPGGLLDAAVEVCNLFVSSGRIVSTKGRNCPERIWFARKEGTFEGFPMAVLVNHYSASASEIVAACLQDHKRAVIIGQRTWGKGSVQNLIDLENGKSALKLTTASYQRPSGKNIHRFPDSKLSDEWGVMPDQGFEIKLGDEEMLKLLEDRRRRDIVMPAGRSGQAAKTQPPATAKSGSSAKDAGTRHAGPAVVDRQLQAAVGYLSRELAKAP